MAVKWSEKTSRKVSEQKRVRVAQVWGNIGSTPKMLGLFWGENPLIVRNHFEEIGYTDIRFV